MDRFAVSQFTIEEKQARGLQVTPLLPRAHMNRSMDSSHTYAVTLTYDIRTAQCHQYLLFIRGCRGEKTRGSDANHEPLNAPAVLLTFAQEV